MLGECAQCAGAVTAGDSCCCCRLWERTECARAAVGGVGGRAWWWGGAGVLKGEIAQLKGDEVGGACGCTGGWLGIPEGVCTTFLGTTFTGAACATLVAAAKGAVCFTGVPGLVVAAVAAVVAMGAVCLTGVPGLEVAAVTAVVAAC